MNRGDSPFSPEERLYALYGKNPPVQAVSRLKTERFLFTKSLYADLELIRELRLAAENAGTKVTVIGFGASFIAWLCGCTSLCPLPPHRLSLSDDTVIFCCEGDGWDLPTLIGHDEDSHWDGHEIPIEGMLGRIRDPNYQVDFSIAEFFTDQATEIIQNHFGRQNYALVMLSFDSTESGDLSFALVPKDGPMVDIAEDGIWHTDQENVYGRNYRMINLFFDERKEKLRQFRRQTGKEPTMTDLLTEPMLTAIAEKITAEIINEGGHVLKPDRLCFSSLLRMYGYLHSTYTADNPIYQLEGAHYSDVFCFREQVYDLVQSHMDPKYRISSEFAIHVTKRARSGRFTQNRMDPETELTLRGLGISDDWIQQLSHTCYLSSKADLIPQLLEEMQITWYERNAADGGIIVRDSGR